MDLYVTKAHVTTIFFMMNLISIWKYFFSNFQFIWVGKTKVYESIIVILLLSHTNSLVMHTLIFAHKKT
jgi:hypothetical protein